MSGWFGEDGVSENTSFFVKTFWLELRIFVAESVNLSIKYNLRNRKPARLPKTGKDKI